MRRLTCAVIVTVLSVWPIFRVPAAEPRGAGLSDRTTRDAGLLVFLLQYVGTDYGAAVADGRIVDEAEYRENKDFAGQIEELFARLRALIPAGKAQAIERELRRLVNGIGAREDPRLVREASESAIPKLVEAFELRAFPRSRPDPRHAAALYEENCRPCHGPAGGGDGPRARELDPAPASFTDRMRMGSTPPYAFYNAITFGVKDTAMASFADSLSDQERWDLAFYLWTFELSRGAASVSPPPVVVSLRDLATRSSEELAPEVVRQAAARGQPVGAEEAERWVAELRARPLPLTNAEERLARVRQDLAQSVSHLQRGELEQAADLVTTSYLNEFEPLEPELDRRDPRIRERFERGLVAFRTALRRDDRQAALADAKDLEATIDRAAEVLAGRGGTRAESRFVFLLLGITVLMALLLFLRSFGKRSALS